MSRSLAESVPPVSSRHATRRGAVAMPYRTVARAVIGAVIAVLVQLAPAEAQQARFVATTGDDAGNCTSPATPCRTLQGAHDIAAPGNKIIVLDSGEFGTITITKSIAIVATGVHAQADSTCGACRIAIEAGPDDVIDIDGLSIQSGAVVSDSGIDFISGGMLHVGNCAIDNFEIGIHVRGSGAKRVFVSDCTITGNGHGILARGGGGNVHVLLDRVTVDGNSRDGVRSQGGGARVRISNSTITGNRTGLRARNGGKLISLGNNIVVANGTNGAPTATASPM